jgi:AraC-like DNA-binding protein
MPAVIRAGNVEMSNLSHRIAKMANVTAESKGSEERNFPRIFAPEFPPIHDETVEAAFDHVLYNSERLNAKNIAAELGISPKTVYKKANHDAPLTIAEFLRVGRLALAHGDSSLVDLMLPDGFVAVRASCDGEPLEQEIADAAQDLGLTISNVRSGRFRDAQKTAAKATEDSIRIQNTVRKAKG